MKKLLAISIFTIGSSLLTLCSSQIITTIAGDGGTVFAGDGGQATDAEISGGGNVVFDKKGNMYFCDQRHSRIRKVDTAGIITTVAGTIFPGFGGDGGPATAAQFNQPTVVTFDSTGNMYIADASNYRIRKINTSGIVSTFAGIGVFAFSGNGGPATAAELAAASCVIADDSGNIYIADSYNAQVRKVNTSGIISAWAGNSVAGYSGDGGNALSAEINICFRIAFDKNWNMYITDNNRVRMVNTAGIISTVAGNGYAGFTGDGGPATAAEIMSPYGVCTDALGNIFIDDALNNRVREINSLGIISTLAGNDSAGFSGDGGPSTAAELNFPVCVNFDYKGNLYVTDYKNYRIRKIPVDVGLGINELSDGNELQVFPNPSNSIFTFSMKNEELKMKNIEVYNVLGKKVKSEELRAKSEEIDMSNQPNGVYFYRVLNDDGTLIGEGKIIVTK